ncbi:pantoate--beta-alanine ligase [Carboxylicivirga sediminis]|uniref:Pantothenate synthetase n=1 Tax=Carboxylicivirga sediminis TaxID=2006564 RepID=A0A941F7P1_9BACT|nr:pantoate--beta-alanine ligase [Carboxylicivirga sediminis]MBR8537160.1 pantoate--beta-alanine ligase [Carboxylicivirga sediminis]
MQVVHTVTALQALLENHKQGNKSIGFVPTMGALHNGHLSLVEHAASKSDIVVVSIFVNPTQFNNAKDLDRYPRDLNTDLEALSSVKCDIVFAPSVEEVYPEEDSRQFNFGSLETVMEGRYRPGHFNGVAQVVSRLFDMVKPDKAFFGLKDFQQLVIITEMTKQLQLPVKIVPCDIVREADGLAMSSRNMLLTDKQRKNAPAIARTLFESCNFAPDLSVEKIKKQVEETINATKGLEVEYFEIVDGYTLQPVDNWEKSDYIVGCIAVFAGEIRLIDNVTYKNRDHEC